MEKFLTVLRVEDDVCVLVSACEFLRALFSKLEPQHFQVPKVFENVKNAYRHR